MENGEDWEAVFYDGVQARGGCTLGDWRADAKRGCGRTGHHAGDVAAVAAQPSAPQPASPADQASEIAKLRRELDRTRMERDILKKAVGIFAEMPR